MHPAGSVIWFTTLSGAGYGLLFLVGILSATPLLPDSVWFAVIALGLGLGLVGAGLISSTLHLGRPERAWRAFSQWRSSWLSREGVSSVASLLPAAVFAIAWVFLGRRVVWAGLLMALLAFATVVCTAMIYACLKPIPRWHNRWVLPNYLLLALAQGALLLRALLGLFGTQPQSIWHLAWIAILAACLVKLIYWWDIGHAVPAATAGSATGLAALGQVRLLDAPHTEENYLLKEMGFRIARKHAIKLRAIAFLFAFLLPLALTLIAPVIPAVLGIAAAVLAALSVMLGVLVERWLFFAEAKHVVTLYYGASAV
jgi:DMSO reductase anchor subunit